MTWRSDEKKKRERELYEAEMARQRGEGRSPTPAPPEPERPVEELVGGLPEPGDALPPAPPLEAAGRAGRGRMNDWRDPWQCTDCLANGRDSGVPESCPSCGGPNCLPVHPQLPEPRKHARRENPGTSKASAAMNRKQRERNLMLCLRAYGSPEADTLGGLTDDEVNVVAPIPEHEAGRRCADLRNHEPPLVEVVPDTYRRTRLGGKGRVCKITPAGRAMLDG